jgi:hypothetical protein
MTAAKTIVRSVLSGIVFSACLIAAPTALAVGPDGANHGTMATAYGPISPGVVYSGYNVTGNDIDVYSVRDYVDNGNLVVTVQDQYSGGDDCEFYTACNLTVGVYDHTGSEIESGGYCAQPGAASTFAPVTLPKPGTYYIAIGTNDGNISCGLGPIDDTTTIPYTVSFEPWLGVGSPACQVPKISKGLSLRKAESEIKSADCAVGRVVHRHNALKAGSVLSISPSHGTAKANSPINIRVSKGLRSSASATHRVHSSSCAPPDFYSAMVESLTSIVDDPYQSDPEASAGWLLQQGLIAQDPCWTLHVGNHYTDRTYNAAERSGDGGISGWAAVWNAEYADDLFPGPVRPDVAPDLYAEAREPRHHLQAGDRLPHCCNDRDEPARRGQDGAPPPVEPERFTQRLRPL